jgi:hypothetical protein
MRAITVSEYGAGPAVTELPRPRTGRFAILERVLCGQLPSPRSRPCRLLRIRGPRAAHWHRRTRRLLGAQSSDARQPRHSSAVPALLREIRGVNLAA